MEKRAYFTYFGSKDVQINRIPRAQMEFLTFVYNNCGILITPTLVLSY